MRSRGLRRHASIALAALAATLYLAHCKAVPLTAPEGAELTMSANPTAIPAEGGVSIITVTGFKAPEDGGGPLPDGTQIFFTTTVGVIEERVAMENGIARGSLRSNGKSGTATVTAQSGSGIAAEPVEVQVGSSGDITITVTANPATLGPTDLTSEIVATVLDANGNPVSDAPVIFSTDAGALASNGSILRTNENGQAFDRLTLEFEDSATVTVTSGTATGSVTVTRGTFPEPLIDSVSPAQGTVGAELTVTVTGQNFQPGATASFQDGIDIQEVTFVNSETLLVDIAIDPGAVPGTRDVTITNPDGGTGTFSSAFEVVGNAPVCRMDLFQILSGSGTQADPWLMSSTFVSFDGTASFDPDGTNLTFLWDVGDPPTGAFTDPAFSYVYSALDIFQVVLTVTDQDGDSCTLVRFLETQ